MRASFGLPTHRVDVPALVTAAAIARLSAAAEDAGFDAVFVTEHPVPGDEWLATGGHHALDPFVALSFAAAATSRVRLLTNLVIPAYRNPFLLAKSVASLDHLSAGRVVLGIGAGYLRPEFDALGVDFDERNDLTDEAIGAMRAVWTGGSVERSGRHWRAVGNTALPRPAREGGPPIWIGGNSRRAMRRAVELADGWAPLMASARMSARVHTGAIGSVADVAARVREAAEHAASVGRTAPLEIAFNPTGIMALTDPPAVAGTRLVEHAAELADAGVTYLNAGTPGSTVEEIVAAIAWYGEHVLPAVARL
ncbi:MAG TPA: TIGR03619 family F420-dependent LLM class oxidoreductase [Acidimicrobiales bacterium]|nr:TIGR03619 family F420-dependent LLM class oxidoreductase [Acidimicrobiales bacterium]